MMALSLSAVIERRKEIADAEILANSRLPPLPAYLEEFWIDIELPDGYKSRTLVIRPHPKSPLTDFLDSPRIVSLRNSPKRPMLIYFHGGNFYTHSPLCLTLTARLLAKELNATILVPEYRKIPEHSWRVPFQDALSLVQTVASNPTYHYGADLEQGFMIAGFSAGGSLAAVVAGLTTADPEQYPLYFPLTGVFLSVPFLLVDSIVPLEYKGSWKSREEFRNAEGINTVYVDEMISTLNCSDYNSPWFSPMNNPNETRGRHPPTCLHACQTDPVRDDTIIYEKVLVNAGVKTRIHVFPDDGHNALTTMNLLDPTKSQNPTLQEETLNGFRWLAAQLTS